MASISIPIKALFQMDATLKVEPIQLRYQAQFWAFEVFSVSIFSVEYLLRMWICDRHLSLADHGPLKARLRFAVTPYALIDLAAIHLPSQPWRESSGTNAAPCWVHC